MAINRDVLRATYGPGKWRERAATHLGVTVRHIEQVGQGRRALHTQHIRRMLEYIGFRTFTGEKELEKRIATLRALYQTHYKSAAGAKLQLQSMLAEIKRQGRTKKS